MTLERFPKDIDHFLVKRKEKEINRIKEEAYTEVLEELFNVK